MRVMSELSPKMNFSACAAMHAFAPPVIAVFPLSLKRENSGGHSSVGPPPLRLVESTLVIQKVVCHCVVSIGMK